MLNDTGLPENKKSYSTEGKGLLNTRADVLLLGGGLLFLLINVIVIFGLDTRPSAWLFYLNMRYWSVSASVVLWVAALWLVAESLDITEDYLPLIRMTAVTAVLIVLIFTLRNSLSLPSPVSAKYPGWFDLVLVVALFNVFRSLFLLSNYFYGERRVDEEAPWCWGVTGFLFAGLAVWGFMSIVSVKTQMSPGANIITESLLSAFKYGLQDMLQTGNASLGLRMFALLLVVASIAFVYVTGRWLLFVYWKLRGA